MITNDTRAEMYARGIRSALEALAQNDPLRDYAEACLDELLALPERESPGSAPRAPGASRSESLGLDLAKLRDLLDEAHTQILDLERQARERVEEARQRLQGIEPRDSWQMIDRWWTDSPERKHWLTLRAPDGATAVVGYLGDDRWEIRPE